MSNLQRPNVFIADSGSLSENQFSYETYTDAYQPPISQADVQNLEADLDAKLDDGTNDDLGKYCVWTNAGQGWASVNVPGSTFSGSYLDLSEKPVIPAAQVNSDWTATSGLELILNKPSLF